MKAAPGPGFYDDAIADPESGHRAEANEGPYAELYAAVAQTIASYRIPPHVVELGCGTGRLASLILPCTGATASYRGVDFSAGMIAEARAYNDGRAAANAFTVLDLRDQALNQLLAAPDAVYVCTEVLEHLDSDLRLLGRIPAGARVIISVPSNDSEAHVRHFPGAGDALTRYEQIVDVDRWRRIWTSPERRGYFHLITGTILP